MLKRPLSVARFFTYLSVASIIYPLALSKSKAFADDNLHMAQDVQYFFDMVENIVGKGEKSTRRLDGGCNFHLAIGQYSAYA